MISLSIDIKHNSELTVDRKMIPRNKIQAETWVQIRTIARCQNFAIWHFLPSVCNSTKRVRSNGCSFIPLATCVWLSWPGRSCKCGFSLFYLVEICFSRMTVDCTNIPRVSRSHPGGYRKALSESAAKIILRVIQNRLVWDMHLFWEFFTTGFSC